MDEEPGAVINRLLEDGDVQIIDPPPPPPPLSANVVRHPVQQTLHNFGRIRKLSPICCTTLLGSKNQEIRHPAPGFLISWVLGGSKTQEIRNLTLGGFIISSVFRNPYQISTLHPLPSGEVRNSRRFAAGILSPSKRPDIKSSLLLLAFERIPKLSPMCCRNPNINSSP